MGGNGGIHAPVSAGTSQRATMRTHRFMGGAPTSVGEIE
jgi:hypothetical protein